MSRRSSRTLYVGNLPGDIRQREVEDLFYKYGPIVHIDLKVPRNPPGFAFVEFMDARDADDAIRGRDGYDFDGHRLRVELAHGGRGTSSSRDRFSGGRGGPHGRVSRRSDYRVLVTGLPSSASPQDLKDHMCKAGDVCFSQVFREGKETTGIADYTNYDDMRYAIRKLDETEFQNTFSRGYIRVKEYDSRQSRSRSRTSSRSRSRSRSQSKSPTAIFSRCSISLSKSASLRSGTKRGSLSSIERIRSRSFWAKEDAAKLAKSQSDYHKIDTVTRSKDPMMAPMGGATLDGEQAKAVQLNIKKLDIKLKKAYKLAKNHSASSQSDYQKIDCVTPSKAPMMASKHQIPVAVHFYVNLVFYDEQRLKTSPGDKVLAERLEYYRRRLDIVVDSYKKKGQLSSDWEYDYETASSFEPIKHHQVLKKPEKKTTPNPHIYTVPLAVGSEGAWQKFKEFDESSKKPTLLGLPCPMDEEMDKEIFTRLGSDDAFVTIIRDVAVGLYNKSCQMYRNKNSNIKNISNAKVKECKYAKVHPFYLFYMNIEVFEQEKNEVYEINLRCNLDDGATVLDSFCLGGPEPLGNREGAHISLESMYETAKDDSLTDPEVRYDISGMVRRTGGYDFYNPLGWDSLSDYN